VSRRLITALRTIAQDCETIAKAARKALHEIEAAELIGTPVSESVVEKAVSKIEQRFLTTAHRLGVRRGSPRGARKTP